MNREMQQIRNAVERRVNNMTEHRAKQLLKTCLYKEMTKVQTRKRVFNSILTGILVLSFVYAVQH